ncbi:MAG: asparaginase [Acidobacteria bacterium]|nr:asparaginase [Acidobacteriota bacterium]
MLEPVDPFVVEVVRSGVIESVHLVDVAVVDERGDLSAAAGEPDVVAAFRSSAKPVQAAVCLEEGWKPPGEPELAVACGSHSGEPVHVAAVRSTLAAAGLGEGALRCPPALPFEEDAALAAARAGGPARTYHNCSGKHAAMLGACAARGWALASYLDPDSPLQSSILARVESLLGARPTVGVDGCGAPTFAAPLRLLARAFGEGTATGAGRRAAAAMRAHPFMVAGSGRSCTALMEGAKGLVVKAGAEGIACAAFPGGALALKVRDGAGRARDPVLVRVLEDLGALSSLAGLEAFASPAVAGGGRPVGELRARGRLAR